MIIGTTCSRVNELMNKFRKLGYIRYNGALEIDAERLGHAAVDELLARYASSFLDNSAGYR